MRALQVVETFDFCIFTVTQSKMFLCCFHVGKAIFLYTTIHSQNLQSTMWKFWTWLRVGCVLWWNIAFKFYYVTSGWTVLACWIIGASVSFSLSFDQTPLISYCLIAQFCYSICMKIASTICTITSTKGLGPLETTCNPNSFPVALKCLFFF